MSLPIIPPSDSVIELTISQAQDVSARVKELMQKIDRLPSGTYELTIIKPEVRAMDWAVDIVRLERIESLRLSKYHPE